MSSIATMALSQSTSRTDSIKQLYRDLLGREADAGGLATYNGRSISLERTRRSMLYSNEHKHNHKEASQPQTAPQSHSQSTSRTDSIKQLYRDLLGREADAGGLATYN